MTRDSERWDQKYQKFNSPSPPDTLLVSYANLLKPKSIVLDIGSGPGHNSIYLAQQKCCAIAVDCSQLALIECKRRAQQAEVAVQAFAADLSQFRFPAKSADAVICFKYLNRDFIPTIEKSLKPGGHVIFKTFNRNFLNELPKFNPAYVLHPGELGKLFWNYEILSISDDCKPDSQTFSYIVAKKTA